MRGTLDAILASMDGAAKHQVSERVAPDTRPYWFGYSYGAFWGWVTFCCIKHTVDAFQILFAVLGSQSPILLQIKMEAVFSALIWPIATLFFGWVVYRLFTRQVGMKMIYALVSLHFVNVLVSMAVPWWMIVAFWAVLSLVVVSKFKEFLRPSCA